MNPSPSSINPLDRAAAGASSAPLTVLQKKQLCMLAARRLLQDGGGLNPIPEFRKTVMSVMPGKAKRLIKLCETDSKPTVRFETKEVET